MRRADQRVDLAKRAVGFLDEMPQIILWSRCWRRPKAQPACGPVVDRLCTSSQTACLREEITTLAPCSAIRSAMARPMRARSR